MSGAFVVILTLAIVAILFVPFVSQQLKTGKGLNKRLIKKHWSKTVTYLKQGEPGIHKAINDADKLLDYVLKKSRYSGETMAQRLKSAEPRLTNVNGVWQSHKLRNRMVHENGFKVGLPTAKRALKEFHQALRDLGAL